ncbi:MAG: helix-turn-helix domain-containing protein [Lachnospiraceae bacterium]
MNIGQRLKRARKLRHISQDNLAKEIGVSRGVITNIELDRIDEPQPLVLDAICKILDINQRWLLYGQGPMEQTTSQLSQSARTLSEIYDLSKKLSAEEQLYILDMIKTYKKHFKSSETNPLT